jgi:hypothetical protein
VVRGPDLPRRSLPPAPLRPADRRGDHPGDYLDRHPTNQLATPSASSWGWRGYNGYWLNESNAWVYRHLHTPPSAWSSWRIGIPRPRGSPSAR